MNTWQRYYQNTESNPPSKLLVEALPFVEQPSQALDLGAGALVDSLYLAAQGYAVTAVDQERYARPLPDTVSFVQSSFQDYAFPKETFNLINAQFSLPFNGKVNFKTLWSNITASLKPGGVFTGQLFGINDEWNTAGSKLAFHTKSEVEELLAGFEILKLTEVDTDGKIADGTPKHWHVFHIIARKKK